MSSSTECNFMQVGLMKHEIINVESSPLSKCPLVQINVIKDNDKSKDKNYDWWRTEYADEVLINYLAKEKTLPSFRSQSPQLYMRRCVVDWMALVAERLKLDNMAIHLAVYLLDQFMDNHDIEEQRLQLAALGCLSVASKFEERDSKVPRLSELSKMAFNAYTLSEFLHMEVMLLKYFDWELFVPTAAHFSECYADVAISIDDDLFMANPIARHNEIRTHVDQYIKYFLDLSLQDHNFLRFRPSMVAAACLASSRICLGLTPTLSKPIIKKTKYSLEQLASCIDIMMRCHEADQMAARSSMKRKSEENRNGSKRVDYCTTTTTTTIIDATMTTDATTSLSTNNCIHVDVLITSSSPESPDSDACSR